VGTAGFHIYLELSLIMDKGESLLEASESGLFRPPMGREARRAAAMASLEALRGLLLGAHDTKDGLRRASHH
jgi:hypothetical protein